MTVLYSETPGYPNEKSWPSFVQMDDLSLVITIKTSTIYLHWCFHVKGNFKMTSPPQLEYIPCRTTRTTDRHYIIVNNYFSAAGEVNPLENIPKDEVKATYNLVILWLTIVWNLLLKYHIWGLSSQAEGTRLIIFSWRDLYFHSESGLRVERKQAITLVLVLLRYEIGWVVYILV